VTVAESESRESLLAEVHAWRRQYRKLMDGRDALMLRALSRPDIITKEDVHQASGLGRTTLDRIAARNAALPETTEDENR
jgi:hypothetical protein